MIPSLLLAFWLVASGQASESFQRILDRGIEAFSKGDLQAAETAFREAQQLEPESSLVLFHLGETHFRRRDFAQAIIHFRRSIDLDPKEARFYLRLADLYSQLLRFLDARRTLEELLRARPEDFHTYLMLARLAEGEGNHALAEQNLRRYLNFNPGDPEGLSLLGAALLGLERYEQAEAPLNQALVKDPKQGFAHYYLGMLYSRQGKDPQARQHLESAIQLLPADAQAHYQLGQVMARLNDVANAERTLRKAIVLAPQLTEAYYSLGSLLRRLGRDEEASRFLSEHNRLSSTGLEERQRSRRVSSLHLEVKSLLEQNRLEEADKRLHEVLQIDPQNDFAFYRLGQILYLRGEYLRALETIRTALGYRDIEPAYIVLEGMCLERLERDSDAAAAYERALSLGDHPDAYLRLSRLELRQGKIDQALKRLRRAVTLKPDDLRLRQALVEAVEKTGNRDQDRREDRK